MDEASTARDGLAAWCLERLEALAARIPWPGTRSGVGSRMTDSLRLAVERLGEPTDKQVRLLAKALKWLDIDGRIESASCRRRLERQGAGDASAPKCKRWLPVLIPARVRWDPPVEQRLCPNLPALEDYDDSAASSPRLQRFDAGASGCPRRRRRDRGVKPRAARGSRSPSCCHHVESSNSAENRTSVLSSSARCRSAFKDVSGIGVVPALFGPSCCGHRPSTRTARPACIAAQGWDGRRTRGGLNRIPNPLKYSPAMHHQMTSGSCSRLKAACIAFPPAAPACASRG